MHSWFSPRQSPRPSTTAKAAGDPSVHVLHNDRMLDGLSGSKVVMIGLIVRPLIPPASLICLPWSRMAFSGSANSRSEANPSLPANDDRETIGKTTLMLSLVTPRVDVLA